MAQFSSLGQGSADRSKILDKGKEVAVEGKLVTRNYTDKDGVKRYTTEVVVNDLLLVGSKPQDFRE
jgi:single-strand DNA-binding protein